METTRPFDRPPHVPTGFLRRSTAARLRRIWRRAWLLPVFASIGVLLLWPTVMLVLGAFSATPPGTALSFSVQAVYKLFSRPDIEKAFAASVALSLISTCIGVPGAAVLAWLSQRTDVYLRRWITPTMMIVFATPPLFYAIAFSLLGNRYTGYANVLLRTLVSPRAGIIDVESWSGMVFVMSLRSIAFSYLFISSAVRAIDPVLDDASRVSGAGRLGSFIRIDLPLLFPALSGAAILCFIAGLHVFDIALVLGEPAGIRVIATQIYDLLVHAYPPQYGTASLSALLIVAFVGALYWVQARLAGRRSFVTLTGKSMGSRAQALGHWRAPLALLAPAFIVFGVLAPFTALALAALQPFPGVYGKLTTLHFVHVLARPGVLAAVRTTLMLALWVGAITMSFALALAQVNLKFGGRLRGFVRFSTTIPFAMPGIVAALAVMWAYVSVPGLRTLYGTVWMLLLSLVVVTMPFAMQSAQAALEQVSPDLAAAARVAGASRTRVSAEIVGRIIAPGFMLGWFVVAIAVAGNLDVPLLLGTPTLGTVASEIYTMQSLGQTSNASALLLCVMGASAAIAVLLWIALKIRRRGVLGGPR